MTRYVVKRIYMGDVEDPDLMVSQPIWEWQQTDAGKYVMKHSVPEPEWHRQMNRNTYGYEYAIQAHFTPEQITFFELKFK